MRQYLAEAWRYRTFAYYWSKADVKARNFETQLGRLWHYLNPFLYGVIYFIFIGIVSQGGLADLERLALIVGNVYVWVYFSSVVTTGAGSVSSGTAGITAQSAIPRVMLPFASAITAANLFLRSLVAYVPLHIIANRGLHVELLWLPALVVVTGLFGFGLSLLLAVLNHYFRDISRLLPHMMRLWLYLSPAVWAYPGVLGEGTIETFARLNPMYAGMTSWTIAFGGPLTANGPTMTSQVLAFTGVALVTVIVGFLIFVAREDEFAVRN